ncbi:TPA: hypothetical protein N0F65_006134, partial [Lagenidium giganteum]
LFQEKLSSVLHALVQRWACVGVQLREHNDNSCRVKLDRDQGCHRRQDRIDKCISALIQHQVRVFRGFEAALSKTTVCSRTFVGVPQFLRGVASILSDLALGYVLRQWDYFQVDKSRWVFQENDTCSTIPSTSYSTFRSTSSKVSKSEYIISSSDGSCTVCTRTWSCSCFHAVSMRLPCQHMYYVCVSALRLTVLPVESISDRWNMHYDINSSSAVIHGQQFIGSTLQHARSCKHRHARWDRGRRDQTACVS